MAQWLLEAMAVLSHWKAVLVKPLACVAVVMMAVVSPGLRLRFRAVEKKRLPKARHLWKALTE